MTVQGPTEQPEAGERRGIDRRQTQVPVAVERRQANRRSGEDRRGAPRV